MDDEDFRPAPLSLSLSLSPTLFLSLLVSLSLSLSLSLALSLSLSLCLSRGLIVPVRREAACMGLVYTSVPRAAVATSAWTSRVLRVTQMARWATTLLPARTSVATQVTKHDSIEQCPSSKPDMSVGHAVAQQACMTLTCGT